MSKYKEIKGFKVQTLATDTAASVAATGSWSSSGALNTARTTGLLAGSISAGLYSGGNTPPSTQLSEEYNGTAWSNGNNMVEAARDNVYGFGTQTAALSAGGTVGATGNKSKLVEVYNGTSWSAGTDINQVRSAGGSAGKSQTAGIIFGGKDATGPGNTDNADTEYWNGSTWAQLADLNTAGAYMAGGGSYTSALCGVGGGRPAQNESWDGTSWSEISEQNTYRDQSGGSADSNTSGLIYAGEAPPVTAITESWDGTTWTEVGDMGTARSIGAGATGGQSGGASSALGVGGQIAPGARTGLTEEWTTTPAATFTKQNLGQVYYNSGSNAFKVTGLSGASGTWASGGALPQVMNQGTGCGVGNTSGMAMTGSSPPSFTKTSTAFQYDGTNWTEVAELNTAKSNASSAKNSPIATTLNYAGDGPGTYSKTNESWNNTSWTVEADLIVAGNAATGFGVSSISAGRAGGQSTATPPGGPHYTGTEIWNGSSWTEVNDLLASRRYAGGVGTVTAALFIGGDTDNGSFPGGRYTARVESWNGTSWSEITDLNAGRANIAAAGIQTSAIAFGGSPPRTGATEFWNGSSWTEISDMAVARQNGTGNGSSASALSVGGESPLTPAVTATVEEWSGVDTNETITVS